jgi:hypothetical protein
MAFTTLGKERNAALFAGEAVTALNNANAYLGVGDSSTAFSAAHTDLQGSNKAREAMDSTYPQRASNVLTYKATFEAADAQFAWAEWGLFDASTSGTMISRKVESHGTKAADEWALTVTYTF